MVGSILVAIVGRSVNLIDMPGIFFGVRSPHLLRLI